jgi:RNA polymerase sigma-70 factor (ECF subfamily)
MINHQTREVRESCLRRLLLRYREADPWAGERLVYRLAPVLSGYWHRVNVPPGDRDDLSQDCWIRIHNACHTFRESEPVLPWIFAVARHTQIDAYRKRQRRRIREIPMGTMPDHAAIEGRESGIFQLLNQLPESQREVLQLMKVEGLTVEEVAARLATSEGAIKQKAHRAYTRLRELLHP